MRVCGEPPQNELGDMCGRAYFDYNQQLGGGSMGRPGWLVPPLAGTAMRLLFQNLVLEGDEGVLAATSAAWTALLAAVPPETLPSNLDPTLISQWLDLASTPEGLTLDPALLLVVPPPSRSAGPLGVLCRRCRCHCLPFSPDAFLVSRVMLRDVAIIFYYMFMIVFAGV
jgi:hypothetical protein